MAGLDQVIDYIKNLNFLMKMFTITFKDNGLLFSRLITSIPLAQDFLLNLLQPIWQKKSHLVKNDLKAVLKQPVSFQK